MTSCIFVALTTACWWAPSVILPPQTFPSVSKMHLHYLLWTLKSIRKLTSSKLNFPPQKACPLHVLLFPEPGALPLSSLIISFHPDHCHLSCGVELTKVNSPTTHIWLCLCPKSSGRARALHRVYTVLGGWTLMNSAAWASVSLRIRISPVSHSEFLAVANHIMLPLTYGLSFYGNHGPCLLCLLESPFVFDSDIS